MSQKPRATCAVLVVDDEALIRWSLYETLTDDGYTVTLAATAAEARGELSTHTGDRLVILLDLRLPDMHDLTLLREIRTTRPNVPVIVMTAYRSHEIAKEAEALGIWRMIGKPFDIHEVQQAVASACA